MSSGNLPFAKLRLFGLARNFLPFVVLWVVPVAARSLIARSVSKRVAGQPMGLALTPRVLEVEDGLWRGPAPRRDGYAELADRGVSSIVDLRSEVDAEPLRQQAERAGIELLWLPIDNTRSPQPADSEQFDSFHRRAPGITYVHCEAGEGRTGAIVGVQQIRGGRGCGMAIADALAVGSLSFAQLGYVVLGGRHRLVPRALEWLVDRPTEALFALAHR